LGKRELKEGVHNSQIMSNLNLKKQFWCGLILASVFLTGCGPAKAGIGKVFVELIQVGIKSAVKNSDQVLKGTSRSFDNVLPTLGRATVRGASRSYDSDRERSY
tara:strand:+ start:5292 stop:5603 length:312 start_codon:yes stop_codon:yes gene_type:complete